MKERLLATALSATLLFAASLRTADAETRVFKNILRPHGHGWLTNARANADVILAVNNTGRNSCKPEG
jgi:hypothetical protein